MTTMVNFNERLVKMEELMDIIIEPKKTANLIGELKKKNASLEVENDKLKEELQALKEEKESWVEDTQDLIDENANLNAEIIELKEKNVELKNLKFNKWNWWNNLNFKK